MRYADFYDCDICNGKHTGMSLFVQGCPFHCKDCFNPETWDFEKGKEWNDVTKNNFLKKIERSYIYRVSILGGEPLCDNNVQEVNLLIKQIKELYPSKTIWIYTGYTWEEIWNKEDELSKCRQEILRHADVLIDGRFECSLKNLALPWHGSSNQRVIDVQKSIKNNKVEILCQ